MRIIIYTKNHIVRIDPPVFHRLAPPQPKCSDCKENTATYETEVYEGVKCVCSSCKDKRLTNLEESLYAKALKRYPDHNPKITA